MWSKSSPGGNKSLWGDPSEPQSVPLSDGNQIALSHRIAVKSGGNTQGKFPASLPRGSGSQTSAGQAAAWKLAFPTGLTLPVNTVVPVRSMSRSYGRCFFNFLRHGQVVIPFHIPTSCVWMCWLLHVLASSYYGWFIIVSHLIHECWYLTVVSTCTSLVTNDVIHPLICLFVTYIYSLKKYLLTSLAHVFNWNFVFLLNFESSLYILYTSPLSFTWPASISCLYLVLHFLDSIFWRTEVVNFYELRFLNIFFYVSCFWCWI